MVAENVAGVDNIYILVHRVQLFNSENTTRKTHNFTHPYRRTPASHTTQRETQPILHVRQSTNKYTYVTVKRSACAYTAREP